MNRSVTLALAAISLSAVCVEAQSIGSVLVANGFNNPVWVGAAPGDRERLFVVEQNSGLIKIIKNGTVNSKPFINVRSKISPGGERGLLGLAFHPDYQNNGFFYVNYTRAGNGATVVERYTRSSNPDFATFGSGQVIIGPITQPFSNHNAGDLAFGPDGYLYIPLGDGGSANDPQCRAQKPLEFLGKILRIDVDGGMPYAIPASNPYATNPEFLPEIWAVGMRNPWRFSFDRLTGDMYIGDVGQNAREEIDFQPASSAGGENYGWKMMEARRCNSTVNCPGFVPACNSPVLTNPIHQYNLAATPRNCTVVGGFVYRGCDIPSLRGTYFFADYCSERMWSFRWDPNTQQRLDFTNRTSQLRPAGGVNAITSFGEDNRGEMYFTAFGTGGNGAVYKIVDTTGSTATTNLGSGTTGGNGQQPELSAEGTFAAGTQVTLSLCDAAPNSAAIMLIGTSTFAFPLPGIGTILPVPVIAVGLPTDAIGQLSLSFPNRGGAITLYGQFAVVDAGASGGVALSNALQMDFQ